MTRAFLCGFKPRGKTGPLTDEEKKLIRNFSKFLQDKGERCPNCLHKAKKHEIGCRAKDCDCDLDASSVLAVRAQIKKEKGRNGKV